MEGLKTLLYEFMEHRGNIKTNKNGNNTINHMSWLTFIEHLIAPSPE